MGLFDAFTQLDENQNQGLLAAAAQMLMQSGPSRTPTSLGQIAGGGLMAFQAGTEAAKHRKMQEQQAQQMAQMRGLQIQGMEGDLAIKQQQRERMERIRNALTPGAQPAAAPVPGGAPAAEQPIVRATPNEPDWMSAYRDQMPQQSPAQAAALPVGGEDSPARATVAQLTKAAQVYAAEGDIEGSAKLMEQAAKLMPEVSKIDIGTHQGKPVSIITYKDGRQELSAFGVKPDMQEVRLGDRVEFVDKNTVQNGRQFKVGLSPDTIYNGGITMRGQNLVSDRAREANVIAARTGAIAGATGLRKEFDDLPEVKSYKKALPAFNAIKDATGRNTTQSDINIVYGLAKLYDPDSVVREGEYATVANSPNIPERVKGMAQYLAGGGRLTPTVKAEILAEAQGRIGSYESEYVKARAGYGEVAKRTGIDPGLVLPTDFKPSAKPVAAAPAPARKSVLKGQVMNGYRFKGGDPSQQSNWEKI